MGREINYLVGASLILATALTVYSCSSSNSDSKGKMKWDIHRQCMEETSAGNSGSLGNCLERLGFYDKVR